jgi:hypothetical protein
VAAGKRYLSPALEERALNAFFQNPGSPGLDPHETLTGRERLILQPLPRLSNPIAKSSSSARAAETHR